MTKILVVEDDTFIRDLVMVRLRGENYEVIAASDGIEGVSLAESEAPDLILMDMRLPLLDGWKATQQIKANPQLQSVPVIALTAQPRSVVQENSDGFSCEGYMGKPIRFDQLLQQIKTLVDNNYNHISA